MIEQLGGEITFDWHLEDVRCDIAVGF